MHYAVLGSTGLRVSRLCAGTDVNLPPEHLLPVVRRAAALGVNFIDTDHGYSYTDATGRTGRSWEAVREWLREVDRSRVVIASKTYQTTPDLVLRQAEEALRELDTPYLDLFLAHGLNTLEDWERFRPGLQGCLQARDRGLVRHVGMSTHTVTLTRLAAHNPELEVLLVTLNITGKVMKRSGSPAQMQEAMQVLFEQGRGVYIMKALARGRVFREGDELVAPGDHTLSPDQVERALTYVFRCPWAHAVTVGMRSPAHVEEDATIQGRVDAECGRWPSAPEA
ncbi:MAG: aldo/keto reductase [Candidatus Latescibacterota bacterium]